MRKVINQQTFEHTFSYPGIYTRLEFEDGQITWITNTIAHEGMQQPLEKLYEQLG